MRKFFIITAAGLLAVTFIAAAYADSAVDAANAKFKKARAAYIEAKNELKDAQWDSWKTIGKAEKKEAKKKIWNAHGKVKRAKKAYKQALAALHQAEMARDAKIDRAPWK